ncbi:iron ABC transporter permease [Paenibacillus sp. CGMCC 1.16610]|uniref:Iron chelate uptake ABC transporter family permease subunit n=1 Tax=Paenibacillus anseongense TaxID=2682845 RepID=A0ABW9UKX6_9BACL|nr:MULTISPECIES: iron ABC transporter permease [Paenibacillus]MBA2942019.1 iron ABC transporter permease [Paenibacillus sp. CGMCC 1.16610]MVQ38535.1 iron chelate uptake ABC transporter family permease subunit [Paenibacillus anseongense]
MSRLVVYRSKTGRFSFLFHRRTLLVISGLTLLTIVLFLISTGLGSNFITPQDVLKTIFGQSTPQHELVIGTLRLPRIIVAILVGASLGVAGSILQGMIRNPLASPDIIGVTGGGTLAAVTFITYFAGTVSIHWLPVAAFVGAGFVSLIIYLLAWHKGITPTRLVLIGIGISAATSSLTMLMIVLSPMNSATKAYTWLTGSVYGTSWDNVYTLLPWVIVFIPLALYFARHINLQEMGDDLAAGLGATVQLHRFFLLFISVALAGSAVAVAGAIGFVGLIAPHIAKKLVAPSYGGLIPVSALIGSLMVLISDTVARTAFPPLDIPAGVFTAAIGAPFFIFLLYRNRNR